MTFLTDSWRLGGECNDCGCDFSYQTTIYFRLPHMLFGKKSNDILYSPSMWVSLFRQESMQGKGWQSNQDHKGLCHQVKSFTAGIHDSSILATKTG